MSLCHRYRECGFPSTAGAMPDVADGENGATLGALRSRTWPGAQD